MLHSRSGAEPACELAWLHSALLLETQPVSRHCPVAPCLLRPAALLHGHSTCGLHAAGMPSRAGAAAPSTTLSSALSKALKLIFAAPSCPPTHRRSAFFTSTPEQNAALVRTQYRGCWKRMLLERPHIRFDGARMGPLTDVLGAQLAALDSC